MKMIKGASRFRSRWHFFPGDILSWVSCAEQATLSFPYTRGDFVFATMFPEIFSSLCHNQIISGVFAPSVERPRCLHAIFKDDHQKMRSSPAPRLTFRFSLSKLPCSHVFQQNKELFSIKEFPERCLDNPPPPEASISGSCKGRTYRS